MEYFRMLVDPSIVAGAVAGVNIVLPKIPFLNIWEYTRNYTLINAAQAAIAGYALNYFGNFGIPLLTFSALSGLLADYAINPFLSTIWPWTQEENGVWMATMFGLSGGLAFAIIPFLPFNLV